MRILVADGRASARSALRLLLEEAGLGVVAEAADAGALWAQLNSHPPMVLLLDWELPGATGVALVAQVRMCCPHVRVAVLSSRPELRRTALAAGAHAFISKGNPPEDLLTTLEALGRTAQPEADGPHPQPGCLSTRSPLPR